MVSVRSSQPCRAGSCDCGRIYVAIARTVRTTALPLFERASMVPPIASEAVLLALPLTGRSCPTITALHESSECPHNHLDILLARLPVGFRSTESPMLISRPTLSTIYIYIYNGNGILSTKSATRG
ncbi:hypothetical protein PPTG_24087 [Phytophthora nicotianae INRA-310]|uniref:Uncharacterized protein n=1 Tax=Phytophthora nicotianae (strain INRA-310) TaxID=761204 RepID=W2PLA0_PHYN3|nr:hypothetical protein PPTG_24087 [Phytophthora nicotianae INRA-310]ETN01396.1 hypothetical protein PPTG_24087 [Phytophthora nicotianae INRA-310]